MGLPIWAWAAPLTGLALAIASIADVALPWFVVAPVLVAAVLAAVHHAEVIAHRIGEPYGTLVLAVAVTTIEVGLIVSLMLAGGPAAGALARDTVFAAVMIIMNGIIGLSLLTAGARHHEPGFNQSGINAALSVLTALTVLTMVLPNVANTPGPYYSSGQLAFVAAVSLILYLTFVFTQTVRHRDYFLTERDDIEALHPIAGQTAIAALALLVAALIGVVMAGKALAPTISGAVEAAGAPEALVGVIIAAIVLMPEGLAAVRAARANRLQDSLNLALGSALASIGLTIPAVAVVSLTMGFNLTLGLGPRDTELLILSLFLAVLSLRSGRTTVLNGVVHLVIFAVYLFTVVNP
ncbi:calcium:proton antiporter [Polymorphobacter fuscus]|uniref:Ionic transporter y4hA n=1 Tax=Sandarakinorhabdus fusca TaxID=1439888 RepID=A0A7C9KM76_9SPHN|nr:ionic transporter y4hA [Polymorphobacter fuscus]KAB7647524.1 ionic transporter y4hA [Polymorphobacter fuscus]MQT16784.1 ionic transporter y4hA [Polymorphobacter fuscus]NJC09228.1 Ca2+:H+ antiporter [Polymorphobacter fuscus]